MKDLTIYHQKKHRNIWLFLGFFMLLLGGGAFFFEESDLGFSLGIGVMYFAIGSYYSFRPYVRIKDNVLWVSAYPFRRVKLDEIENVKVFLDETTLISKGKETLISNLQMSDEDKERFGLCVESFRAQLQNSAIIS